MPDLIEIWLNPKYESAISQREIADYIGVDIVTFRTRLKTYGLDHYLTYYPGKIPAKLRRNPSKKGLGSSIGKIRRTIATEDVDNQTAKELVIWLIKISQKHFLLARCKESRAFLLNEGGMLEWYLEAYPGINHYAFVEKMQRWVLENGG